MKTACLTDRGNFQIFDQPKPVFESANQVLVKVKAVGICGSDIHYYTHGGIGGQKITTPFCIGHEFYGKVAEMGSEVEGLHIGDHVVIDPAIHCGHCGQCRQGRFHTCENLLFLGCPGQLQGALREYVVIPDNSCHLLPDPLSNPLAVMVEPLAIALHSLSFLDHPASARMVVLGCGPIGLSVIQAARHSGVVTIYATDPVRERLQAAALNNRQHRANPHNEDVVEKFKKQCPEGFDAVFECCGQQEALTQAVELLKPGGQLIIIGIPQEEKIFFNSHLMRRKEISIHNVRRQNACFPPAIKLLFCNRKVFETMITHQFPLSKIQEAFALFKDYRDGVIKAVITF